MKKLSILFMLLLLCLSVFAFANLLSVNAALTVSVSAESLVLDVGQTQVFTASASGEVGSVSYEWYLDDVVVLGETSSSYNYTAELGAHSIYVKVTDSDIVPASAQSNLVSITVNSALIAPTASTLQSAISQGQSSTLSSSSVTTGTAPYTYQWKWKTPGSSSYSLISGATSSSYNFVTSASTVTGVWSFLLEVTDSASSRVAVTSKNEVSVAVSAKIVVSVSPDSWSMDIGQSKIFTATASGGSGSYTGYQWYVDGVAQDSATSQTYSYVPSSVGSHSITVTATDSSDETSTQSTVASVEVSASPIVSISPAESLVMDVGQIQVFTASASGGTAPLSYLWYVDGSVVSGQTDSTYSYTAVLGSHAVTCKVIDTASIPVTSAVSNSVLITVNSELKEPSVSVSANAISQGGTVVLSSSVTTGTSPYTYQWLMKAPSGSYSPISGATSSSYSFVTSDSTDTGIWSFILQVKDSVGAAASSSVASVAVDVPPLDHFVIDPIDTQSTGSAFNITVTAKDAYGKTISDYSGTPSLTYSGGSISPDKMVAFVNGVGTTLVTIKDSGVDVIITVTDGAYTGMSNAFTVKLVTTATPAPTSSPTLTPTSRPTSTVSPTSIPTSQPSPTPTPTANYTSSTLMAVTDDGGKVDIIITGNVTGSQISNLTLTKSKSADSMALSFILSGENGTTGFINMTIPKSAVLYGVNPVVLVDDEVVSEQGYTEDAVNFYVSFTTHFSTHQVTAQFTLSFASSENSLVPIIAVGVAIPEIVLIYARIMIRRFRRSPDSI